MNVVARRPFLLGVASVGAFLSGCFPSIGQLSVVSQATPNPLRGVKSYSLAPVTWNGFTYNGATEADWLPTRTPKQRASFANDKVAITSKLLERLQVDAADGETFTKEPAPSGFSLAYNIDSYLEGSFNWTFVVRDSGGTTVDELRGPPTGEGMLGFAPQLNFFVVVAGMLTLEHLRRRYA